MLELLDRNLGNMFFLLHKSKPFVLWRGSRSSQIQKLCILERQSVLFGDTVPVPCSKVTCREPCQPCTCTGTQVHRIPTQVFKLLGHMPLGPKQDDTPMICLIFIIFYNIILNHIINYYTYYRINIPMIYPFEWKLWKFWCWFKPRLTLCEVTYI